MNAARYKLMLSYLPGMASIVNSFQSTEVQLAVYQSLMEALNVRMEAETPGAGAAINGRKRAVNGTPRAVAVNTSMPSDTDVIANVDDLAHDLEEGDSIHSLMEQHASLP